MDYRDTKEAEEKKEPQGFIARMVSFNKHYKNNPWLNALCVIGMIITIIVLSVLFKFPFTF